MKRHWLVIAIFLLAGAVVNVAVAWGCAVAINIDEDARQSYSVWMENGSINTLRMPGAVVVSAGRTSETLPFVYTPLPRDLFDGRVVPDWAHQVVAAFGPFPIRDRLAVEGRGWPMIALWSTRSSSPGDHKYEGIIRVPLPPFEPNQFPARVLPIRPAWFGFAINTLFYAAILWLLCLGPVFALRRFIRARHGLCLACGYPMGESGVCTECGKALPKCAKVATRNPTCS